MRGYKLTNSQAEQVTLEETDKALTLPNDFEDIIMPFINKDILSKQETLCEVSYYLSSAERSGI